MVCCLLLLVWYGIVLWETIACTLMAGRGKRLSRITHMVSKGAAWGQRMFHKALTCKPRHIIIVLMIKNPTNVKWFDILFSFFFSFFSLTSPVECISILPIFLPIFYLYFWFSIFLYFPREVFHFYVFFRNNCRLFIFFPFLGTLVKKALDGKLVVWLTLTMVFVFNNFKDFISLFYDYECDSSKWI